MGKRKCPLCFVRVPWTAALAHSEQFPCPGCHAALELSRFTRMFAGFCGIVGAFAAVHLVQRIFPGALWVTQVVAAIAAFGVASAAGVLLAGDLVVRPKGIT
jgi:hypothetical protein